MNGLQTTPKEITERIKDWSLQIGRAIPFYIETGPLPAGFCYINCAMAAIADKEAALVPGWTIWESADGSFLEAEHHCILKKKDDGYLDLTRQAGKETKILFLPDRRNQPAYFKGREVYGFHNLIHPAMKPVRKKVTYTTLELDFKASGKLKLGKEMEDKVTQIYIAATEYQAGLDYQPPPVQKQKAQIPQPQRLSRNQRKRFGKKKPSYQENSQHGGH